MFTTTLHDWWRGSLASSLLLLRLSLRAEESNGAIASSASSSSPSFVPHAQSTHARSTAPDCLSSNSEEVFMSAPHYTRDFQVLPLKSAILHPPVSTTLLRRRAIQPSLSVFVHELRPSKVDLPQSDAVVPTSCHDIIYWGDLAFK